MKRQVLTLVGVLGLLLVAGSAWAQNEIRADVPFKFQVNRMTLASGHYTISTTGTGNGVLLIRGDGKSVMVANAIHAEKLNAAERTKLVFRCYGDRYFLSEIWTAGNNRGRQLPKSAVESEVALNTQEHDVVLYASLR